MIRMPSAGVRRGPLEAADELAAAEFPPNNASGDSGGGERRTLGDGNVRLMLDTNVVVSALSWGRTEGGCWTWHEGAESSCSPPVFTSMQLTSALERDNLAALRSPSVGDVRRPRR